MVFFNNDIPYMIRQRYQRTIVNANVLYNPNHLSSLQIDERFYDHIMVLTMNNNVRFMSEGIS